jgi:ribonucleoside-diphosphate reductase alpha chain
MEIKVKKRNGRLEDFNAAKVNKCAERACEGLDGTSASELILEANVKLFDKIRTSEIDAALIEAAKQMFSKDPNYSYVASRLLVSCIYKEVLKESVDCDTFAQDYQGSFIKNIKAMVKAGYADPALLKMDLKRLASAIDPDRDFKFKYLGIRNLKDRYMFKLDDKTVELPQAMFMRVAMGLCINEEEPEEWAIKFYDMYSTFRASAATPTLFNSGMVHSQTASCFLNTFDDSIDGIFDGMWQEARKSKFSGGLGFDVSNFRATGSHIKGTNGQSSGLIPWMKLFNDMLIAVNQGGRRKGSGCAYCEPWHLDFEEFIDLRKSSGDERRRAHDMNTAAWMPDEFFHRLNKKSEWYFFDPHECPKLHKSFGAAFSREYRKCIKRAKEGDVTNFKVTTAGELWKKILKSLFETGHPFVTFKDPCNIRYSNQHDGVVNSSNLCTEIMLQSKPSKYKSGIKTEIGETAICQLSSINLTGHFNDGGLDYDLLAKTVRLLVRAIDNAIDVNFYPTEETKAHLRHRPIGIGMMGYQDYCYHVGIPIDSDASVAHANRIHETISYNAILGSSQLAEERGVYDSYEGSLWDEGVLPIDSYRNLMEYRRTDAEEIKPTLDWGLVRKHIQNYGMRNSNTMAIAPTATISYIQGCEQSIEPSTSLFFTYKNLSGQNVCMNPMWYLKKDLEKEDLWSRELCEKICLVYDGDISEIHDIPDKYKEIYKTAYDRDMKKLVEVAASRQKWIDQGQSFNIWYDGTSMKEVHEIYLKAWESGLKTTYYFRNQSANTVKKTTDMTSHNDEEPAECTLGEECESCQ